MTVEQFTGQVNDNEKRPKEETEGKVEYNRAVFSEGSSSVKGENVRSGQRHEYRDINCAWIPCLPLHLL